LTSSKYDLDTNKALIWIEFTKTTFGCKPTESVASKQRDFVPFPDDKKNLTPDCYLWKASHGASIRSSIPDAMEQSRRDATSAQRDAAKARKDATRLRNIGLVALLTLAVALIALHLQVGSMVQSSNSLTTSVAQSLATLTADSKLNTEKLVIATDNATRSQSEIERLRQRLDQVNNELDALKQRGQAVEPSRKPNP
jgi:hypothetical protein